MDDEIEAIKKKKLEQLQQQLAYREAVEQQQEIEEEEIKKERKKVLSYILTSEARERLTRIRMARPEFATAIENQLILLAQSGRLQQRITDDQLKDLLSKLSQHKRDIKIVRRGL